MRNDQIAPRRHLLALPFILLSAGVMAQQESGSSDVPEPVARLIELYTEADDNCRLSMSDDPVTRASCAARTVYGAALNEEDWCYGKEGEPNATMEWHACGATSLQFAPEDDAGQ